MSPVSRGGIRRYDCRFSGRGIGDRIKFSGRDPTIRSSFSGRAIGDRIQLGALEAKASRGGAKHSLLFSLPKPKPEPESKPKSESDSKSELKSEPKLQSESEFD